MRTIWRQKEKKQITLLPYWAKFFHEFTSVYACIVKHYNCFLVDTQRHLVKEISNLFSRYVLHCAEPFILVVTINHSEDVESRTSF